MNRRTFALFFAVAALSALLALPASAFTYKEYCYGFPVTWWSNLHTITVPNDKFNTPEWKASLEAARLGWNKHAPGSYWSITYEWLPSTPGKLLNQKNELTIADTTTWQWDGWAAVTRHISTCANNSPGAGRYLEADTLLNPDSPNWDKSTNPVPSDFMKNTTLVLLHEHGHVMGLGHEDNVLATMNSGWPGPYGGPIGNNNDVHPLGDDARGARNAYGTKETVRDVAASAVRLVSPGVSRTIPAPGWTFRNSSVSFPFTILNRGTTDQTVLVHFYMSPTRYIHPATSYFLGSTTIALQYGRVATGTAYLNIPANAPSGYQYFGWYTDPNNGILEPNYEGNNGVALVSPTYVSDARVPNACFTATPTSGTAPLNVTFDASCTTDPDGHAMTSYQWDFGDGSIAMGKTVSYTYSTSGNYIAYLTVTDPHGAQSTTYQYITVAPCQNSWLCPDEPD
jgi:hypothetical protein